MTIWDGKTSYKSLDQYINGNKLGFATGTISILAYWITGNTILASSEATLRLGILGALGYSFIGSFALICFSLFAYQIKNKFPDAKTIGAFYSARFGPGSVKFLLFFVFLYMMITLVTQGQGIGYVFEHLFGVQAELAIVLAFGICILYTSMGGLSWINRIGIFQVITLMSVTVILPAFLYFQVDLPGLYQNILIYHPDSLQLNSNDGLLFLLGGTSIGLGQVFMDNVFWQRNYMIRKSSVIPSFIIGGLAWAVISFAFSSLTFMAFSYTGESPVTSRVLFNVVYQYGKDMGLVFLFIGLCFAITSTIAITLNSMTSLLIYDLYPIKKKTHVRHQIRIAGMITIILGLLAMLLSMQHAFSMLEWIMFFGIVNAAFIFPTMASIVSSYLSGKMVISIIVASIIIGFFVYFKIGFIEGTVSSGLTSALLTITLQSLFYLKEK
jgi:Na+/proline symporter